MRKEYWKDIPGWEGYYQASTLGNIRRTKNKRLLKPRVKRHYLQVGLTKENKTRWCGLHRLVALTFIENPNNMPQVNHKDENRMNNAVDNLEWCDASYNCNYGSRNKRISEKNKTQDNKKAVQQCDMNWNVVAVYESQKEAERATGIDQRNISKCCRGAAHYFSAGGYKWKFVS